MPNKQQLIEMEARIRQLENALKDIWWMARHLAAQRRLRLLARARDFGKAQLVPGLAADQTIALVPGSAPTPACLREVERDASGSMPYALFLAEQRVAADGRIGGDVVFARDLGPRNELLRARFGDRTWYSYRPSAGLSDTSLAFVPYDRLGVGSR